MKRKYLIYLLALLMAFSPAAVFADAAAEEAPEEAVAAEEMQDVAEPTAEEAVPAEEAAEAEAVPEETAEPAEEEVLEAAEAEPALAEGETNLVDEWNADRTIYYGKDGNPVKGLFKAESTTAGYYQLYYADETTGKVRKSVGLQKVSSGDMFVINASSDSGKGFRKATEEEKNKIGFPQTYIVSVKGNDYYIQPVTGKVAVGSTYYYVQDNGTVKTTEGIISLSDGKYFVQDGGAIRTSAGMFTYGGKKYIAGTGGKIRNTAGIVSYGGDYYVAQSDGSIRTTTGFYRASSGLYYVSNSAGVLAASEAFKIGSKKYHAMSNGVIAVGCHKWGKYYYFADASGALRTKTGVVKYAGKYYHVKKGGKVTTNKKVKYKKKYYIASNTGAIYTRIFTWKKNIYYSNGKGVLRTKKGFITYDGKKYYVRKGGKIYKNKLFKVGGKKYLALSDGHIGAGLYIWKGNRYLTNAKGAIISTEGLYDFNGKTYYVKPGGVIPSATFVTYKDKHYYVGSEGTIVKSRFTYKRITITPNSRTGEISMEDYVKVFPDAAPKETDN